MDQCIFCMIANGEMSARKVYEDDDGDRFRRHRSTGTRPHAHHPEAALRQHERSSFRRRRCTAIFAAVPKVAEIKGLAEDGYRVIVNNGKDANQTVGHLHVHIMGGRTMSHGMVNFEE